MRKPIILLGPEGSGKNYMATQIANCIEGEDSSRMAFDYPVAKRIQQFIDGEDIPLKVLGVENIPNTDALNALHNYLSGIAAATGVHPLFIFSSWAIDPVEPLPQFRKIICSHDLYRQNFNEKYGSDRG